MTYTIRHYVGDPAGDYQNRRLAGLDPLYALQGEVPHVIDEWQEVPGLWDAVRFAVDQSQSKGRFILTGSSVPPKRAMLHSGTGRIARLRMRPMSLAESGDSSGEVSLAGLFAGEPPRARREVSLDRIIGLAARGGWPGALSLDERSALEIPRHYIEQTAREDMSRLDGRNRNAAKVGRLLRALARNNQTMVSNQTLLTDVREGGSPQSFSEPTLISYLDALKKLFVIEELAAWSPKLRSSVRVRTAPRKHFVDPSLAIAALNATAQKLRNDLNTFGFMFENMAVRDMKVYAEAWGGTVYHYRDNSGLEADMIVEMPDGRWAACEVKLGVSESDKAADSLLRLKAKILEAGGAAPAFLAVICGVSDFAYTREDGVLVIPLTTLGA